ncbi:MAG: hypothetical protein QGG14_03640, partial [Planctomycetota bacterium]|nr:hypothetical protein [Planctomycetota bacterium]
MSVALDANPRTDPPLDFPDREFGELSHQDYAELGFLCGLEVHQQLLTDRKLFCRCPAGIRSQQVDAEVLRHMRPTLSELGEYDGCALMEYKTRKEIIYQLARSSVCTYEMDDTPPFLVNQHLVADPPPGGAGLLSRDCSAGGVGVRRGHPGGGGG